MPRLIVPALAVMLASASVPAEAGVHVTADPECRVIRYLPNGRRIERPPVAGAHRGPSDHSAHVTGAGQAAGVSVSASAGGTGYAHATASSSSGRQGRSVTTTHDDKGCTVVIDERARGARR